MDGAFHSCHSAHLSPQALLWPADRTCQHARPGGARLTSDLQMASEGGRRSSASVETKQTPQPSAAPLFMLRVTTADLRPFGAASWSLRPGGAGPELRPLCGGASWSLHPHGAHQSEPDGGAAERLVMDHVAVFHSLFWPRSLTRARFTTAAGPESRGSSPRPWSRGA